MTLTSEEERAAIVAWLRREADHRYDTIRSLQHRVTELENALRDLVPAAYFGEPATKAEFYANARKLLQTLT